MAQGSYKDDFKKDVISYLNNLDVIGDSVTVPSAHHDHSAHAGGEHSHAAGGHDHGGMKMYFHWGVTETILFESWTTQSEWGMVLAVVLVFVMGFLYEGLRWLRIYLQKKKPSNSKAKKATSSVQMLQMPESSGATSRADNQTLLDSSPSRAEDGRGDAIAAGHEAVEVEPKRNGAAKSCHSANRNNSFIHRNFGDLNRLLFSVLYMIQLVLAYWLMLIVMTYNNWLTIAVIFGAAAGHWMFADWACLDDDVTADACH